MPGQFERILDKLQKKLGKQTIRKASTIARPKPRPDVIQMQAINDFVRRNPRADGGLLNGSSEEAAAAAFRKKVDELMDEGYEFGEAVREAMRQGYKEAGLVTRGPYKGKYFARYQPKGAKKRLRKYFDTNEELQTFLKSRPGYVPPKSEILQIAKDLKEKLGRLPTQTEVAKEADIAIATVKSRLDEGVDFAKPLTKLEAAKLGGKKRPDTAVLEVSDDLVKKFKELKFVHISPSLDTTKAGSKKFRVKFSGPIANDFADIFVDATEENLQKIANDLEDIVESNLYKNKAKKFKTKPELRKLKRLKEAMYRKKDPYGIYEKLRRYKAKIFPGDYSKEIQIQHGQPKFSTQTLSRFGFIDKDINISPEVEMTERIRNEKLSQINQKLKSTTISVADKRRLIEEFNNTMKGLKGQLKGTKAQGLVNFELLDIDEKGNVSKLKDTGFNPRKGLVASDEDLSKISKERASELIKLGKQKIKQEAMNRGFINKAGKVLKTLKPVAKKVAKALPVVGTAVGIADVASAYEQGVRNPIDLFAAYQISPETALASKQYREDPEYRQKSRQATFARPLDEGTYDAIDESFTSYFDGGIVSVLKGVK